jgi:hypothetical protein
MLFFIISSTALFEFLVYLLTSLGSGADLIMSVTMTILPEAAYNCIVAVIVYFFAIRLNVKVEESDKSSRRY